MQIKPHYIQTANQSKMKKTILILCVSIFVFVKAYPQAAPSFPDKALLSSGVSIAGISKGEIEKDVLLKSKGLSINDKSPSWNRITSFRMTLVVSGANPQEFVNEVNGQLTPVMNDAIKNAPPGSKLFFEYIKAETRDHSSRSLLPGSFILK